MKVTARAFVNLAVIAVYALSGSAAFSQDKQAAKEIIYERPTPPPASAPLRPPPPALDSPEPPYPSSQPRPPDYSRGATTRNVQRWARRVQENYPAWSLLLAQEGTVGVRVIVLPNGRVKNCRITQSTGFWQLDEGACKSMTRYARFSPALDREGNPTTGVYSTRITYALSSNASLLQMPTAVAKNETSWLRQITDELKLASDWKGEVKYLVAVRPNGRADKCEISLSSKVREVDFKVCELVKSFALFEAKEGATTETDYVAHYRGTIEVSD